MFCNYPSETCHTTVPTTNPTAQAVPIWRWAPRRASKMAFSEILGFAVAVDYCADYAANRGV